MNIFIFVLTAVGGYLLLTARFPGVYAPAAAALRKRAPKKLSQMDVLINSFADTLQPHIDLEPIKRVKLQETLKSLGHQQSPEHYQAQALARSMLIAAALSWSIFISPLLGLIIMAIVGIAIYTRAAKQLESEMEARRQRIERELPQFASTIRQSLNSTVDVVSILGSYRKICGPVLAGEIDRTLNDMVTGNPERAIKALESRVSSAKLGQLCRGLLSVLRGDDQRMYFDMLSMEYRKSQDEEVKKALLKRPDQLNPFIGALFICLILMICAALGAYLAQQMGTFLS